MNPKQPGRRRFLKGSAALVGGLAAGALQPGQSQQPPKPDVIRPTGVRLEGEVSHFVKSVRKGTATNGRVEIQLLMMMAVIFERQDFISKRVGYLEFGVGEFCRS
jgi:hypothetical protein